MTIPEAEAFARAQASGAFDGMKPPKVETAYVRKVELAEGVTLYQGDSFALVPTFYRNEYDAVVSDPPYGIAHRRGKAGNRGKGLSLGASGIANDDKAFDPTFMMRWPSLLWGANHYAKLLPAGRWLAWDKVCNGGAGDFSEVEFAWCSHSGPSKVFRHMWMGVQRHSQVGEARQHPTEKPVALLDWCIGFFPTATRILDPFAGSGTTGVAAVKRGLGFTGIEIDAGHFETACRRIDQALREPRLFDPPKSPHQEPLL